MDVNMKEKKTEMNLILFFNNSVSYQKILKVIKAIQPISWSIGSQYKFIEDSSTERKMKLILKVSWPIGNKQRRDDCFSL